MEWRGQSARNAGLMSKMRYGFADTPGFITYKFQKRIDC